MSSNRYGLYAGSKAHQFLTLLGALIGLNLVLAMAYLPSNEGVLLVLLHVALGLWLARLWLTGQRDAISDLKVEKQIVIAASLALLEHFQL